MVTAEIRLPERKNFHRFCRSNKSKAMPTLKIQITEIHREKDSAVYNLPKNSGKWPAKKC
jgi:hypothetical protein